mgnify:CR=1 FL=1
MRELNSSRAAFQVAARIAHAWGIYAGVFPARVVGTSATWLVLVAGALVVLGRVA